VRQVAPMPPEPMADEATRCATIRSRSASTTAARCRRGPRGWYLETNPDRETQLNYVLDPLKMIAQTVSLAGDAGDGAAV